MIVVHALRAREVRKRFRSSNQVNVIEKLAAHQVLGIQGHVACMVHDLCGDIDPWLETAFQADLLKGTPVINSLPI